MILRENNAGNAQFINPLEIFGRYLSSECGPLYRRCRELFVWRKEGLCQYVVFVPLDNGILLVGVRRDEKLQLSIFGHHIIDVSAAECSPVATFAVFGSDIFFVCVDQARRYLTVAQIYLNATSIASAEVDGPLVDFRTLEEPPALSDFEFISLGPVSYSSQRIYFATGSLIYALVPESYLHYHIGEMDSCRKAESLVYSRDDTLIAYCNESAVYFDLQAEVELNASVYSDPMGGQPIVCSDRDVYLVVHQSTTSYYIVYGQWSLNIRATVDLQGTQFDSGVCFGVGQSSFFAYIDRSEGVFVQELFSSNSSSSLHRLSSSSCPPSGCEPLAVFQHRYLATRAGSDNDRSVVVVDTQDLSSAPIISAEHTAADLLTLLVDPAPCSGTTTTARPGPTNTGPGPTNTGPGPTSTGPGTTSTNIASPTAAVGRTHQLSASTIAAITVSIVVVVLCLVLAITVLGGGAACVWRKRRHSRYRE